MSETKITVIYDNPTDPEAFESAYQADQLEAARKVPGYVRLEASKVWPKEDGSPTPAYRMIDWYFTDYDAASAAVTTEEFGAFAQSLFQLATGGVRILFSDVEIPQS
ncbi:EthD family reductase [Mycobacterium hodleri]|uniref:EthD family reductase n=1 Tax=Mycolicibacterium hodleri TaxID=49897 RepID=UPI000AE84947|nr:EthD family reductase [Mycolicibacterium hodleri]MCV7134157.1 EthD family reductase [Mycolicibacterium hodleri]